MRRDPLVDHVALLEEQLPGRDRGPDDGDHQQHDVRDPGAGRKARHEQIVSDLAPWRVGHQEDRDQQQAEETQRQREPLEAAEVARARGHDRDQRRQAHAPDPGQAQEVEPEAGARCQQ